MKKAIASHTLKSLDASHTFCNGFGCRKAKEQTENDDDVTIFSAKEFSMPSRLLASSPITGVPMRATVVRSVAMK